MRSGLRCVVTWGVVVMLAPSLCAAEEDLRLLVAVKHQDAVAVRALLAQQVDVNARAGDGSTALHWAVYVDDRAIAGQLVRAGANPSAADDLGVTPLYLACLNRNDSLVAELLKAGANPNATSINSISPLMIAARTGSVAAVHALIAHGANVNASESARHQTALMWAAANKHPDVVRALIDAGADMKARTVSYSQHVSFGPERPGSPDPMAFGAHEKGGSTAMFFAARAGDVESARLLVGAGADVNDTLPDGQNAVIVAARSGHEAFAQFLVEHGSDPNASAAGYTPLHAAVLVGARVLVKTLLSHGGNVNAVLTKPTPIRRNDGDLELPLDLLGATPFMLAAKYADLEILRLLSRGADSTAKMRNGTTVLMAAAGAGWRTGGTVDRRGVDYPAAVRGANGLRTESVRAREEKETLDAVALLLDMGVPVNETAPNGNTALFAAVTQGFDSVVQLLVSRGADVNIKNKAGQTPLSLAKPKPPAPPNPQLSGVADLLLKLGARE